MYGLNQDSIGWLDLLYRRRLQSEVLGSLRVFLRRASWLPLSPAALATVDDVVEQAVNTMAEFGQLNNTYFVFSGCSGLSATTARPPLILLPSLVSL